MRVLLMLLAMLALALLAIGCVQDQFQNQATNVNNSIKTIALNCTVCYVDLEGGFYGLECGGKYLPINLPDEYKQDGLRVSVVAKPANVTTIYMWGVPVEILEIQELS